ncbi:MAG TPA: methionyl-tRNA formyltransferase [Bacteroidales bacterium]|nr:methionyl-tRNA formyltransferase [Bacteroidales bacterium]
MHPSDFRIVFMGTPEFAVPSLQALFSGGYDIRAVVTAPDRPAGRGLQPKPSAVKQFATQNGLRVLQPQNLKDESFLHELQAFRVHLIVVVAFRMLPEIVWSMPAHGSVNLHASLLPQYRGAAPINWAIINGERHTGLTTFFLDKEIDTGRIIRKLSWDIGEHTTAGELHDALMLAGARLLQETVDDIREDRAQGIPQGTAPDFAPLHKAPKLTREHLRIDWARNVQEVHNQVRGLSPYPGAFTTLLSEDGKSRLLKVFFGIPGSQDSENILPGTIKVHARRWMVRCSDGWYIPEWVQLEGKQKMKSADLVNGLKINKQWSLY